jgi:hypothetical protein
MAKWLLALMLLILIPSIAYASIGIGIEPTIAYMTLSNQQPKEILRIKIYDESTTPDNYTFNITDDIKNYLSWECGNPYYWCLNNSYFVPAGLNRSNAYTVDFLFVMKTNETIQKNFTIIARAQPLINNTGMVGIIPQVAINVYFNQINISTTTTTTTTTTATTTTQNNQNPVPTLKTTTTTTTTTISKNIEVNKTENIVIKNKQIIIQNNTNQNDTNENSNLSLPFNPLWLIPIIAIIMIGGFLAFIRWY